MGTIGTEQRPLRVAVVGSGPSGFYAAEAVLRANLTATVHLFDRLPTPFGLVRGGVAPDHPRIKSVTRAYDKVAARDGFQFFGNVRVGQDIRVSELLDAYDQVVLAVGCESANRLGIPGEELPGSHSATDFVGWYNGHPDHVEHQFDLSCRAAVVIGVGNVAMDVARVLAKDADALAQTDISAAALEHLRTSQIRDIYVLGRRGAAQAAFSPAEIQELDHTVGAELVVRPSDAEVGPVAQAWLDRAGTKQEQKNVAFLASVAGRTPTSERLVHVRLRTSPVALRGQGRVEEVEFVRNELVDVDGRIKPRPTDDREVIKAGLVLRAVGYRGIPLPGAPFDERLGRIPNVEGRVTDTDGEVVPRLYVAGWIKRGPSGLIGTNRADSKATVAKMLEDVATLPDVSRADPALPHAVTWSDWGVIDEAEQRRGAEVGKPREKFLHVPDMLGALDR